MQRMTNRHGAWHRACVLPAVMLFCVSVDTPAAVEQQHNSEKKTEQEGKANVVRDDSMMGISHRFISHTLERTVRTIDKFFANEDVYDETTKSYARLRMNTAYNSDHKVIFDAGLNVKLDLPETEDRFNFLLESESDQQSNTEEGKPVQNTASQALEGDDYFAGLRRYIRNRTNWNLSADAGIRLRNPIDPFVRVRYRRRYDWKPWHIAFRQSIFYFRTTKIGSETKLEFNRYIYNSLLMRMSSKARWTQVVDKFSLSQRFSLYHTISDRSVWAYEGGVFGRTHVWQATLFEARIRYRHRIKGRWLFLDTGPQVLWGKGVGYRPIRFFWFGFEAVFGDKYLQTADRGDKLFGRKRSQTAAAR